ncbi:hypothetical protein DSS3PM1_00080 [Bacteriophage DSS3_PM1]|nr:hypothetical protein DSS3PM1_00080 [Bacteriophage DSS3_PM1]
MFQDLAYQDQVTLRRVTDKVVSKEYLAIFFYGENDEVKTVKFPSKEELLEWFHSNSPNSWPHLVVANGSNERTFTGRDFFLTES